MSADTLSRILAYKREDVATRKRARPLALMRSLAEAQTAPRNFLAALEERNRETGHPALIAEIKKASPSKGVIRADFDPPAIAQAYAAGGAACLSVLTDGPSFQGDDDYLARARDVCDLPALRKDFIVDVWQIHESRALGADAVLVILAAVDDALARDLIAAAHDYDMAALVEVHDEAERDRALALPTRLIGVNNRDLRSFETRLETTERLAAGTPPDRLLVAESGLATPADVARVARAGARAILVGEALMRQADIAAATRTLLAPA